MYIHGYDGCMKVDKMSVSFSAELGDAIRKSANEAGTGLSSWLAEAASAKLRGEALATYLDDWEARHGSLSADELERAAAELGLRSRDAV